MGTRTSPAGFDNQNPSPTSAACPSSPRKAFDISSQWSATSSNMHSWTSPIPSSEVSSSFSQVSKDMQQSWVHLSQDAGEFSSSPSPQPSNVHSQWLVASSSPPSPVLPSGHVNSPPMPPCSPRALQSNVMTQTDVWASQSSVEMVDDLRVSSPPAVSSRPVSPSVLGNPISGRAPCSKVLKGQYLSGQHCVFDIDMPHPGEAQAPQQLDVLPISVYGRDPAVVTGRQIAVNRRYICYCLRPGSIRILSRNVATRALFQGHTQRVTDMAFFAENVHLLASASSDGRILVWKIMEGPGTDGKLQLLEQTVLAMQLIGEWKDADPRVCWHPYSQECLLVGINKHLLKVDINEVGMRMSPTDFTAENPVKCHIMNLINGVQCFGMHDNELTDLSAVWRDNLCVASASKDGTVRIWGEKKMVLLSVLVPHEGQAVSSVNFISAPNQPDHIVLLTGGPTNSNLKLWVPGNARGSVNAGTWCSIQTLELKSSSEGKAEQAFLNQVCVVQQAGLILLGNTKKHAMYSVHLEFGSTAAATCMDYLVEFSMTMPILSLTAMAESIVNGKGIVQVFCVQTQVIQQYFLNVSFCIPSHEDESAALHNSAASNVFDLPRHSNSTEPAKSLEERSVPGAINPNLACEQSNGPDSGSGFGSWVEVPNWVAATVKKTSRAGSALATKEATYTVSKDATSTHPLSPLASVSRTSSSVLIKPCEEKSSPGSRPPELLSISTPMSVNLELMPPAHVQNTELRTDLESKAELSAVSEGSRHLQNIDTLRVTADGQPKGQIGTTSSDSQCGLTQNRLITPSELMTMAVHRSSNFDPVLNFQAATIDDSRDLKQEKSTGSLDAETRKGTGQLQSDVSLGAMKDINNTLTMDLKDDGNSVSGDLGICGLIDEVHTQNRSLCVLEESQSSCRSEDDENQVKSQLDAGTEQRREESLPVKFYTSTNTKRRRNKNKNKTGVSPPVPTLGTLSHVDTAIEREPGAGSDDVTEKLFALQESFYHLTAMQKELQKQVSVAVVAPMAKEAKRVESAVGKSLEENFKAHSDALWTQIEDDNRKREEFQQESMQQFSSMISNIMDKELPSTLDRVVKKEVTSIGSVIARMATPNMESAVAAAVHDSFQGFREKIITELEKALMTRLDNAASYQMQTQFKSSGKHSLQDDFSSCFNELVVPMFESSCREMLERADASLHEEMVELAFYTEQQLTGSCFTQASTVMDAMVSASLAVTSIKEELAEGQKRLLTLVENAGTNADPAALNGRQNSGDFNSKVLPLHRSDSMLDMTIELSILLREGHFEKAFTMALSLGNISVVSWLCMQVDPKMLFAIVPLPLSQRVLLSLMQQIGCDLGKESMHKLTWIQMAALALNLGDPLLGSHMRPLLEQLFQNLQRQMAFFNSSTELTNQARLVMHLVNSLLTTCT